MSHVVVTGAAGFIGSHLSEALLAEGWQVTGVDSFDEFYDPQVKRRNVAACLNQKGFKLVEADIRDAGAMEQIIGGDVDAVVHLAARAGVRPSIEQPVLYHDVNVMGTTVVLEAARKHNVGRFIFGSSSSVYGNSPQSPFSEELSVDHPISPYAATKKAGELICHAYHHLFGINISCLRFFTVYGPRQRPDLAIHKFARLIEAGKPIPVFGDGTMMRDHTFVKDIVSGVIGALDRCRGYAIYNLGHSQPISLNELIARIEEAMGKKASIERLPLQPGDVERTYADISRARQALNWAPQTDLSAGLASFVEWFRRKV